MKLALLFLAGLLMEIVWATGTVALQRRAFWLSLWMAGTAPYLAAVCSAVTVVDETDLSQRFLNVTCYAAGAIIGLAATWPVLGRNK